MKKLVVTILLIFCGTTVFCQDQLETLKFKKDFYMERSKKQNKTGWILLGTGAATTVIALYEFDRTWDLQANSTADFFGFLALAGVIAGSTGVIELISAGVNKSKADKIILTLDTPSYPNLALHSVAFRRQPQLTLRINF